MENGKVYLAGIYARLSVEHQDEKSESIQNQIEIAKAFLKGHQDIILCGCYSDLGRTGTNFQREGFNRLMADVRLRKIDCIIVKDFSRFGRNYIETGNYIQKIFPFLGVRFIAVTDRFDSLNAQEDELGVNLKNLVNEMYARDISLKVKSARKAQREKGSYTGGTPPYGYRTEWIEGKRCLLIEEETAPVVKKLYQMYGEGSSMKDLIRWLHEEKVHRPKSCRRYGHAVCREGEELLEWAEGSLKILLTNPVYLGYLVWPGDSEKAGDGREYTHEDAQTHEAVIACGAAKMHEAVVTHEAIVTKEEFGRVAKRLKRQAAYGRGKEGTKSEAREEDIFEGLLFCGECGKRMRRISRMRKSGASGKGRRYGYFCANSSRIDSLFCQRKYISYPVLNRLLKEVLKKEAASAGLHAQELLKKSYRETDEKKREWQKKLEDLNRQTERRRRKESELYMKYRDGYMSREEFLHQKEAEEGRIRQVKERQAEIEGVLKMLDTELEGQNRFLKELLQFDENMELNRELLGALIERIKVFPDQRIEISFCFSRGDKGEHLCNSRGDTL